MTIPYRAGVNERWFLNLPGFHGRAYVVAYVEDTSARDACPRPDCNHYDRRDDGPHNFEPRMILEIADCEDTISLEFDVDSEARRANSLHKLDTLIAALRVLRKGLLEEFAAYDPRERGREELKSQ